MRVIIVGGGIIGAALAHRLGAAGADVTVFDSGAGGATAASFGWINASFYLDQHHFALRAAGIEAWRALGVPLDWSGCLCWDHDLDAQYAALTGLGYAVEDLDQPRIAALEPRIRPPARALRFGTEGVADPVRTTARLLTNCRVVRGVRVTGIATDDAGVTGIVTAQGMVPADRVIVAAGCDTPALLSPVGVSLPMLDRPGVMMRTAPVARCLSHVLATPEFELRQDADGRLWSPTAAQHQADDSAAPEARPDALADAALPRVQALLPDVLLAWDAVMLARRPVPGDQRPAFGPCGPDGLFASVMHSGITLAAIVADLLGALVMGRDLTNAQADLAAPYTLDRFQSSMS